MAINTVVMSDIERIVYDWLTRHKIDFQFQTSMSGGFYELGGIVVDFLLPERGIAIRVMGEYYHRGAVPEGKAEIQREELTAMGWIVVDCWGDDLKERLDETMTKAIRGEEML